MAIAANEAAVDQGVRWFIGTVLDAGACPTLLPCEFIFGGIIEFLNEVMTQVISIVTRVRQG